MFPTNYWFVPGPQPCPAFADYAASEAYAKAMQNGHAALARALVAREGLRKRRPHRLAADYFAKQREIARELAR